MKIDYRFIILIFTNVTSSNKLSDVIIVIELLEYSIVRYIYR